MEKGVIQCTSNIAQDINNVSGLQIVSNIQELIRNTPGEIIPKIRYLVDNILEVTIRQNKVCKIEYDVIPKLFAFEDNDLYTKFLELIKNDLECISLYKLNVGSNIYDEFLFMSLSFIHFVFTEINNTDLIISNNFKDKNIRILKKELVNQFTDMDDEEVSGSIKIRIPVH